MRVKSHTVILWSKDIFPSCQQAVLLAQSPSVSCFKGLSWLRRLSLTKSKHLLRKPLTAQGISTRRPSPSSSSRQLPKVISAQEQIVGLAHLPSQFLLPTPLRVMILRHIQTRLPATNLEITSSYQDIQSVIACQRVLGLYKRNLLNCSWCLIQMVY